MPRCVVCGDVILSDTYSDHVFYFSYKQPPPTGDALDLWANAEELDRINREPYTPVLQT